MSDKRLHDDVPAAEINPSVQPSKGEANSAPPSTRSGSTRNEKHEQTNRHNPEAASPEARGAGDVRFTSYPQNEAAQNPAAREGVHGDLSLNCSDCEWKVSGNTEEEVLGYMRAHARQVHAKSEFTPAELESARRSIHKHKRAA
jgi:predicted small metal-binding protein